MTTAYTSLLGLALPTTGELQGTWGDTVNNSITSLLDSAVAGTTTLSTDGDVTLSTTTGAANQARQAILLCSGARTAQRTITAPAQSKIYTVINNTTGGYAVKLVGVGPTTGVTIPAGTTAQVAWNGSDFVDVSGYVNGSLTVNGNLTVKGNTTLGDASADTVTVNGTITSNLLFTDNTYDIGASGATRPRNLYLSGLLTMGGALTVNGNTTLGDASADTVTVNGTITSNLIFTDNTYDIGASGATRPRRLYLGSGLVVSGTAANNSPFLTFTATSNNDAYNFASTTFASNLGSGKALVHFFGRAGATKDSAYIGYNYGGTAGSNSSYLTLGLYDVNNALVINGQGYIGINNTSPTKYLDVGGDALINGITAGRGTNAITTNTAFGASSLFLVTTGLDNTAVGYNAGGRVSSGNYNTFLGKDAGQYVTTGNYNIFIGAASGTTSANPLSGATVVGVNAAKVLTGRDNTLIGANSGEALTSGTQNTFIGTYNQSLLTGSGGLMTTGSNNSIFGNFNGNQSGLDIRTSSNFIVLSDGEGNVGFSTVKASGTQYSWALPGAANYQGTGITFPATQNASSNANTLDDYEEGTWSPAFVSTVGTNPTITYSVQYGTYVKVGRMVIASIRLSISTISGGTANLQIGGFPFTADNTNGNCWTGMIGWNSQGSFLNNHQGINFEIAGGDTRAYVHYINSTGATFDCAVADLAVNTAIEASIVYMASA